MLSFPITLSESRNVAKRNSTIHALILMSIIALFINLCLGKAHADPLLDHLRKFTRVLSTRNLDSLRLFIDPNRIFVEVAPKEGAFLSPSQTLGVVESFFRTHQPASFSYVLVKEEGKTGIAIGTLIASEETGSVSHKVNFGFQKNSKSQWLLSRVSIH